MSYGHHSDWSQGTTVLMGKPSSRKRTRSKAPRIPLTQYPIPNCLYQYSITTVLVQFQCCQFSVTSVYKTNEVISFLPHDLNEQVNARKLHCFCTFRVDMSTAAPRVLLLLKQALFGSLCHVRACATFEVTPTFALVRSCLEITLENNKWVGTAATHFAHACVKR